MTYVIAYDVGTTSIKTCLFKLDQQIKLICSAQQGYGLYLVEDGGVEQDVEEWWDAMCATTRKLLADSSVRPEEIAGMSFCSQGQGLVLVDRSGAAVRRPMSYMDQRSKMQMKRGMSHGIQIAGGNVVKLLQSLVITGAASLSVKDPLWKYKWVEQNEPEVFNRVYKWLDVKEYLICRCTGKFVMTEDSAFATFLYDTRKGREGWSRAQCKQFQVNPEHLPDIIKSTDVAGELSEKAAAELGLVQSIPVFGGGMDTPLTAVGAGCFEVGQTHIYCGTSGWVSTILDKQVVDVETMIGAGVEVERGRFFYFAEMETAGKCFEWVKDHLVLDEIGVYTEKKDVTQAQEAAITSLYDYITRRIKDVPAGAGGLIFTPWLHGNRCPFEDPNAAGMFFNLRLETGKEEMIRAVIEGVCYHLRWMLESQDRKIKTSDVIRFVGGGALAEVTCQMLADITGRTIETVASPQNVGAVGAAALVGVGLGIISKLDDVKEFIPAEKTYDPDLSVRQAYDRNFEVFKRLYQSNKKNFALLNA